MDIKSIKTHNLDQDKAFEILCNQIFENWIKRNHNSYKDFIVVNGDGGDGGVEAYTTLKDGSKIANQVKWFVKSFTSTQTKEIGDSIKAAMANHPEITKYIIFIPRDLTNVKIVDKEKQLKAKSTDYSKTEAIKTLYQNKHKDLTIEFWGEHKIISELQEYENIGIRKFWFEDSIIHYKTLEEINEKSFNSWLRLRYVSDLYKEGFIEEKINKHLYTVEYRKGLVHEWRTINSSLFKLEELLLKLPKGEFIHINQLLSFITKFTLEVNVMNDKVRNGERSFEFKSKYKFDKSGLYEELKSLEKEFDGNIVAISKIIDQIDVNGIQRRFSDLSSETDPKYIIFSGPPGSGKTQAVASVTKQLLSKENPAIVIQAKYRDGQDLRTVLQSALGGFTNWSEIEILQALESLAHIYEVARKNNEPSESVKVLISIDGIEEAKRNDWEKWKNLINGLSTYCKKFPRIQFIVTCREYFLDNSVERELPAMIYELPHGSNVQVVDLFDDYVNFYNAPNDIWLKTAIKSLLALKLFCSIYRNKRDEAINVQTSLTSLIKTILNEIQREVSEEFLIELSADKQIFVKIVGTIADILWYKETVTEEELKTILTQNGTYSNSLISHILGELERHGMLKSEQIESHDSLVDEIIYRSTNQSYIDFLIAQRLAKSISENGMTEVPAEFQSRLGVLQIASNILLKDYGIEIGDRGSWGNIEEKEIEKLLTVSIGELDPKEAGSYSQKGILEFKSSVEGRNRIFDSWIFPSADNTRSPFNGEYLHRILSSFKNEYERDKIWSGPAYGDNHKQGRISDVLYTYKLSNGQKFNGMPLVFAWSLTTIDNIYREYAKTQLTAWAYNDIEEFIKLLNLLFGKYDAQMDEDLSLVILGIASIQLNPSDEIKKLSKWIDVNVFALNKISIIKDAVVRHCCRAFQERAFNLGLISESLLNKARPPYKTTNFEPLPLYAKNTTGREGEIFPIVHDLAWYVIKESYDGFLDYDSDESDVFLNKYNTHPDQNLQPFQFAMYAALAYIKKLGYDQDEGAGYTEASHGSLSKISTFEEKYTWLAVNYIKGYLADNVPFDAYDDNKFLDEYSKILKVKNPANDIKGGFNFPEILSYWIVPQNMVPPISNVKSLTDGKLKSWVKSIQDWDFRAWLEIEQRYTNTDFDKKEWIVLDNYTTMVEETQIGQVHIKSTALLIEESNFSSLLKTIQKDNRVKREFDPVDLHYSPDVDIYISPIDVIWMDWIKEIKSSSLDEEIGIRPTTCEVVTTVDNQETYYLLPSREIRDFLGVKTGNGKVLLANNDEIVGFSSNIGEAYHAQQRMLIVDKSILGAKLKNNCLKMIWSVFVFQKAKVENPKEIYHQDCQMFLVWEDNGKYHNYLYHQGRTKL
ncbi:ATP-binding protein [Sphingobacterium sp. MYb388]|uniref:ATP-binding protein n=1 Tax=Sphingobacterium sp. MYb388 TaxID=2745437 RepID=UPI0030AF7F8E